ncbi:FHA domain-containing protein [Carex littledalei]|uniref:FHA domain-containing protein n=1 Tax=Carex littledalei TaxID=544730 RepID=A0A833UZU3_9POAL|nr:FHA domain-containing protein [Carex littledalei]
MAVASAQEKEVVASNGGGLGEESPRIPKCLRVTEEEIRAVAQKLADEPLQIPGVWGVLTAISYNARQRNQGMNIQLSWNGHRIGRSVEDSRFQINCPKISATHCHIYKAPGSKVYVNDRSTNGTYLNWSKLTKGLPHRLCHGDILSFAALPHDGKSYAYVYREVCGARSLENDTATLKRQREEVMSECKRQKGIGIGSADGPVSLDDVRSLQRSNSDLRQQLESHVRTIENLRNGNRESLARHENEVKELKETISSSFDKNIKELKHALDEKHKELDLLNTVKVELESSTKDLNERLSALKQSCADADEIILSQKSTISELEKQLEEERKLRREEREKATEDLKFALEKVQAEAKEETKRQANNYQRQHKEQQEVINKLQECEKESRLLVETLRSKLEDARENLITSEKKARQLESQVQEEQLLSTNSKKRCEALESELRSLKDELENEKVAREEAWAKVSALELEIAAAIQDLSMEKQRFQGARERLILRETQLRAFYSTTEEISALFAKQQDQLKAMQRTLEDEEDHENTLTNMDLNQTPRRIVNTRNEDTCPTTGSREVSQECVADSSSNGSADEDTSSTEKNGDDNDTQDLEFTSIDRVLIANVDGVVAVTDTERILETESEAGDGTFKKCCNMVGETMQLDEETHPVENLLPEEVQVQVEARLEENTEQCQVQTADLITSERILETESEAGDKCCNMVVGETMQLDEEETHPVENLLPEEVQVQVEARLEETVQCQVQTADLLTSEAVGSWAISTAPSVNGENESLRKAQDAEAVVANALICLGSQSSKGKLTKEQKRLNAMIEIVDPEFRHKFSAAGGVGKGSDISDAETEEGDNDEDDDTMKDSVG